MSKKKISQIVGLTIGATAIAATGIGSSIALTSCTGEDIAAINLNSKMELSVDNLNSAFGALTPKVLGKTFDELVNASTSINDDDLTQQNYASLIQGALSSAFPAFGASDVSHVYVTTQPNLKPDTTFVESVTVESITIVFGGKVTLPQLDGTDYSLNPAYDNSVVFSNITNNTVYNTDIVDVDGTKSPSISSAVDTVLQRMWGNGKTDNSSIDALNNTSFIQSAFKSEIADSINENIARSDAKFDSSSIVNVEFSGDPAAEDVENMDITYAINFDDNVNLVNWSDEDQYFQVIGQTITSNDPVTVRNPNYTTYAVQGSAGQAILDTVKTQVQAFVADNGNNLNSDTLNTNVSFQNDVKKAISGSIGCPAENFSINFISITGTGADSQVATIQFNIDFDSRVNVGENWNGLFNKSGNTISSINGVQISNPNFKKVTIDPNNTATISSQIETKVRELITNNPKWDLKTFNDDQAFITSIKNIIAENAGADQNSFKADYITNIIFTSNDNNGSEIANISYTINFDNNVAFASDWTSSNYNVVNNNSLVLNGSIATENPNYQPIEINADKSQAMFDSVKRIVENENKNGFNSNSLNNAVIVQQAKDAVAKAAGVNATDVDGVWFNVSVNSNEPEKLNVKFDVTFKNNVTLTGFPSDAGNIFSKNGQTLTSQIFNVVNKDYNAPKYATIDQAAIETITKDVHDGLGNITPDKLVANELNDNAYLIGGIKDKIVKDLSTVPYFNAKDIASISFQVDGPSKTNNSISVTPTITFADHVILDGVERSQVLNPYQTQGTNPFLTNDGLTAIQTTINAYISNLEAKNPNSLNDQYLNNSSEINNLLVQILANNSLTNFHITADNLGLKFNVTPNSDKCSVSVGYTITFKGDTFAFAEGLSNDSLAIDLEQKTATSAPVDYANYVIPSQVFSTIYDAIGREINTVKDSDVANVTVDYLNQNIAPKIQNQFNTVLAPKDDQKAITAISFTVDMGNDNVTADVTFGEQFAISGQINTQNISPTGKPKQYEMSFDVTGLKNYVNSLVTTADINILDNTVASYISSLSLNDVNNDYLNGDNSKDKFLTLLRGNHFNSDWIDKAKMNFNADNSGHVTISAPFIAGLQLPSTIENNTFTKTVDVTDIAKYLSKGRFGILADAAKTQIVSEYNKVYNNGKGDYRNFTSALNTDTIKNNIINSLNGSGFDTKNIISSAIFADFGPSDEVAINYTFTVSKDVILEPNAVSSTGFIQSKDSKGNYVFSKEYGKDDGISSVGLQRTAITADTLNKITKAVHTVIDQAYQNSINGVGTISYSNCISSKNAALKAEIANQTGISSDYFSLTFNSNDQITDGNMGNVSFTLSFNPTKTKFIGISGILVEPINIVLVQVLKTQLQLLLQLFVDQVYMSSVVTLLWV